jgi:hypothetical protein
MSRIVHIRQQAPKEAAEMRIPPDLDRVPPCHYEVTSVGV